MFRCSAIQLEGLIRLHCEQHCPSGVNISSPESQTGRRQSTVEQSSGHRGQHCPGDVTAFCPLGQNAGRAHRTWEQSSSQLGQHSPGGVTILWNRPQLGEGQSTLEQSFPHFGQHSPGGMKTFSQCGMGWQKSGQPRQTGQHSPLGTTGS